MLAELSAASFHPDRAQARHYSARALTLARKLGNGRAAANAANVLADIARLDGRTAQAIRYARQALSLARQEHDATSEADSLNSLGLIYWHRGECDRAIEFFTQCLDRCIGNEHVQARAFNNLSLVNWEKGDLGAAMEYQQRSLDLRLRSGNRYDIGISQLNLGLIYGDMGDWDRAIECYYRALVELEKHGDATDIALCYNNLGEVHLRRNKLDKAREMLETAIRNADELPSPWVKAEALGNLGEVHFRQGDFLRARDCYEQDITLSSGMADKEELAETWRRMAELLLRTGELEPARKALATAQKLTVRTGVRREIGNVGRVTGNLHAALGEMTPALQAFEQALGVFKELGNSFELGRCRLDYGRALVRFGDKGAALKHLQDAEDVFRRLGAERELETATHEIAGIASGDGQALSLAGRLLEMASRAGSSAELGSQVLGLLRDSLGYEPPSPLAPHPSALAPHAPLLIGADTSLREIVETIRQVAPTRACVLIRGESGTGKELVARTIHRLSERSDQPFVAINCAAIPETLLESELFGIEKGTATGVTERKGKFEQAQGGTIFLDEIGDMSLALQAKLLRVLQEREIERVGGRKTVPVDIRIVAATNRNLERAITEGKFREDLFYRLNVVPLLLPPLRERRGDIAALAGHFAERFAREYRRKSKPVSPNALAALNAWSWPGNVRELENVVERAVVLARSETITPSDLPPALRPPGSSIPPDFRAAKVQARSDASVAEKDILVQTLTRFDWNITQTAEYLKLSRRHMYRLVEKYGIVRRS